MWLQNGGGHCLIPTLAQRSLSLYGHPGFVLSLADPLLAVHQLLRVLGSLMSPHPFLVQRHNLHLTRTIHLVSSREHAPDVAETIGARNGELLELSAAALERFSTPWVAHGLVGVPPDCRSSVGDL